MYHRLQSSLDAHHVHPRGIVGRYVGARMARQHQLETDWTLSLLQLSPTDRVLEIGFGAGRLLGLMGAAGEFCGRYRPIPHHGRCRAASLSALDRG
jgi:hypothetical protein